MRLENVNRPVNAQAEVGLELVVARPGGEHLGGWRTNDVSTKVSFSGFEIESRLNQTTSFFISPFVTQRRRRYLRSLLIALF